MDANRIVIDMDRLIPAAPFSRQGGSLLIMVGLPGTGKSLVVENARRLVPCVVISTDRLRRHMRQIPTYTAAEMMLVYEVCHRMIEQRLNRGQRIIFDGTNLVAARRQYLFNMAQKRSTPLAVCHVVAAESTIRERLLARKGGGKRETDMSDAGWSVYQWMVAAQEPIIVPHLTLDTTETPPEALAKRLANYWQEIESRA